MLAIVVINLHVSSLDDLTDALGAIDPPSIPHFAGTTRIAIEPVASEVVGYLDQVQTVEADDAQGDAKPPWDSPQALAWAERNNAELRPKIDSSTYTIGVYGSGPPDAKQAVEIGFTLLLGKPLVLAVAPGSKVPPGLAKAAYDIIEYDMGDVDGTARRINEVVARMADEPDPA